MSEPSHPYQRNEGFVTTMFYVNERTNTIIHDEWRFYYPLAESNINDASRIQRTVMSKDDDTRVEKKQRDEWLAIQARIASQVRILPDDSCNSVEDRFSFLDPLRISDQTLYYGGVDVSFPPKGSGSSVAVYVILNARTREVVYCDHEYFDLTVPYIPTFLAFREIDPLRRLVEKQKGIRPDLVPTTILVDGNGILHPRCAGIACFLGVLTGIPTIGIGKNLYCEGGLTKEVVWNGIQQSLTDIIDQCAYPSRDFILRDNVPIYNNTFLDQHSHNRRETDTELIKNLPRNCLGVAIPLAAHSVEQGSKVLAAALLGHGEKVTTKRCVRIKNPIFVSPGHNVSLQYAIEIAASLSLTRIPEPIRQADLIGRELQHQRVP